MSDAWIAATARRCERLSSAHLNRTSIQGSIADVAALHADCAHLSREHAPPLPDERVLIVDLPRVLRDIIRRCLDAERGIALVGETVGDVDLPELVHATRADVVVMGLEEARLPEMGERLLAEHPGVRLLGVAADGRESVLYELRRHRRSLGEMSPRALVTAVRGGDDDDDAMANAR